MNKKEEAIKQFEDKYGCKCKEIFYNHSKHIDIEANRDLRNKLSLLVTIKSLKDGKSKLTFNNDAPYSVTLEMIEDLLAIIHLYYLGEEQ